MPYLPLARQVLGDDADALALSTFLTLLVFKPIKDLMHDGPSASASGRSGQKDGDASVGD